MLRSRCLLWRLRKQFAPLAESVTVRARGEDRDRARCPQLLQLGDEAGNAQPELADQLVAAEVLGIAPDVLSPLKT